MMIKFESPSDDFSMPVNEPLPTVFLRPIKQPFEVTYRQDPPASRIRIPCHRYRLEEFQGTPRYIYDGIELH